MAADFKNARFNKPPLLFNDNIILLERKVTKILEMRQFGLKQKSLSELMKVYLANPSFFNTASANRVNILTNTNEILGVDLEGKVYGKNEKVIMHTHGVYLHFPCMQTQTIESAMITESEFANLLRGEIPTSKYYSPKFSGRIPVYREEDLPSLTKRNFESPCIVVLPGNKYFKDPSYYCDELEFTQQLRGFEKNGLLLSRTLQSPSSLMDFIKNKVTYFRQVSPLVEPVILSGSNGSEKLFQKYSYRIMPLILSDGEISKEAKDAVDLFDSTKTCQQYFFVAIDTEN